MTLLALLNNPRGASIRIPTGVDDQRLPADIVPGARREEPLDVRTFIDGPGELGAVHLYISIVAISRRNVIRSPALKSKRLGVDG